MNLKTIIMVFAMTVSMNALAVCNTEDLTGYWDYYEADDTYAVTCSLRISRGNVSLHRFGCDTRGQTFPNIAEISGELTIDSYCHVSGTLVVDGRSLTIIKATLNQGRATIHGIGVGPEVYASFTLTKFY